MRRINFLTNAMIPGTFGMYQWDRNEFHDIVLKSPLASFMEVSEMELNIYRFSAIDENGVESYIREFENSRNVNIKGMPSGSYIRTALPVELSPGKYNYLRFYIDPSESILHFGDRSQALVDSRKYLDFRIKGGLDIREGESPELILRFDFVPYTRLEYLRLLKNFFGEIRGITGKLSQKLSRSGA